MEQAGLFALIFVVLVNVATLYAAERPDSVLDAQPGSTGTAGNALQNQHPCTRCLNEAAVVDIAKVYLHQAGVFFIGEPSPEILKDFPWRGNNGLRWWFKDDVPDLITGQRMAVEYFGESGISNKDASGPAEDLTWRVKYQTGWVEFDRIEALVDAEALPLEALAEPPKKRESYFVIHALTGAIAMTDDEVMEGESQEFYRRHADAKSAARDRANSWLNAMDMAELAQ